MNRKEHPISFRLRGIAAELDEISVDPLAIGLIESIVGIFGKSWWERQEDARLAEWYRRALQYLEMKS